jgi:hypothetical protein
MKTRRPVVRITQPGATAATAVSAGAPGASAATAAPAASSHEGIAATYSDTVLEGIIADASRRNLRDYSDHETRWWAARSSACRAERRARKAAGTWSLGKGGRP